MNRKILGHMFAIAILLTGCNYVSSSRTTPGTIGAGSITYSLQDTIVDLNLADAGNGVNYRNISLDSRTVADRNAQIAVRLQSNPVSKETLTINVDDHSNLLASINSTVDGQLDEIVVEAGRSLGQLRGSGFLTDNAGGDQSAKRRIASFRVGDAIELAAAKVEFRRRTGIGVSCLQGCTDVSNLPPTQSDSVIYYRTPSVMKLAFCQGECRLGTNGLPDNLLTFRTVETFNSPQLVSFPIRGSAFGEVVDNITFAEGMPKTVQFNGANEALDIVKVPGAVVGAVFAGIAAGLGNQSSVLTAEKALADAEKARADARKASAEATIAEIEAIEKLNCVKNPDECVAEEKEEEEEPEI